MKTATRTLFFAALAVFLVACAKTDTLSPQDEAIDKRGEKMVTVPFKVNYLGNYTFQGPNAERCGDFPPYVQVIVDGEGTGTHVGNSTVHFDFCVDITDGTYGNAENTYIVAANGDTIFISVEGQVIQGRTEDHPEYVTSYWRDPFTILGGTGRFEGATGGGMTDDYNSSEDPHSHHDWDGTITMKK